MFKFLYLPDRFDIPIHYRKMKHGQPFRKVLTMQAHKRISMRNKTYVYPPEAKGKKVYETKVF